MYEQFFKLDGWPNKLSLVWKGPSWQPGLPRLGNHQYPEVKYPIIFHHPKISMVLSIYTLAHFSYVLVQYSSVLRNSNVKHPFVVHHVYCMFSELLDDRITCLRAYDAIYSDNFWCRIR